MNYTFEFHDELASTNTLALDYLDQGKPEGLVIVAEYQSAGRGKPGNSWLSPRGKNLLFTVLLRPKIPANQAPLLTQIVSHAVAKVLKSDCGIDAQFKKPNDILVRGKKICGVLIETSSSPAGKLNGVAAGVGLNVNAPATELIPAATSIRIETGKEFDRQTLLQSILTQLTGELKLSHAYPA